MTRRILAYGLLLAVCVVRPLPAAEKPNILFILVDDLGKEWISCYGAEGIETPNIDKLAAAGMKFDNAYCMPQCTPTRVTLLTGQYPFRHGWTNHWDVPRWGAGAHFDPKLNPCYPLALRRAGYKTAAAGKWQIDDFRVEPRAMSDAGFDEWCMWTGYESGNPPSAERYANPYIAMNGVSAAHNGKFGPDVYCDFLVAFMKQHKDEPMLLYFPMALTHGPLTPTPDTPDAKGKAAFPGMVRYTDKLVGRLVAALDELGIRDKTYIIFTTDNGSPSGIVNKRLGRSVGGAKAKMVEAGTAIPFIVVGPGIKPGVTTDALVDFTDIAPTFTDLAGTKLPGDFVIDGRSFAPLLRGEADDSPRQWIMSMGGHPAKLRDGRVVPAEVYDERVVRDKRFKAWVSGDRKITKLYDLRADPWEQASLVASDEADTATAREKFAKIIATFPEKDAAPAYTPNPPQKWDRTK